jgi:hypothetical protein
MNSIKWYWVIPIIGIFFIEEMIIWLFDNKDQHEKRKVKFSYIFVYQIAVLITSGTMLLAK